MCIIVDANAAHDLTNLSPDGRPVMQWLLSPTRKAGLIIGGKLALELSGPKFGKVLFDLRRAGRLHVISEARIEALEKQLKADNACVSNDAHVVALSLVSKCNLVFTRDQKLHVDLKAHSEAGNKIAIYQNLEHSHLLTECRCPANICEGS